MNTPEKPVTIHFCNLQEMKIGRPYLGQFGKILHDCCNGVGVMYEARGVDGFVGGYLLTGEII